MKKRIITLLTLFVLMHIGQSCKPEHFQIIDIRFNAAQIKENKYNDKQQIVYTCTSTIKDKLVFIISYETEYLYGQVLNFGNVCYATTVPRVYDNQLRQETFSLTFDKSFTYYGDTIAEAINIFEVESIAREIDKYENYMTFCSAGADIVFDFSDTFFKNANFEFSEYTVTFSCKTTDEREFRKTANITFEK